jgi:hypothetical protein
VAGKYFLADRSNAGVDIFGTRLASACEMKSRRQELLYPMAKRGHEHARPTTTMIVADTVCAHPASPNSTRNDWNEPPTSPTDNARPANSASGPQASSNRAPAMTIGAKGNTHGLKIVKTPGRKASIRLPDPSKGGL